MNKYEVGDRFVVEVEEVYSNKELQFEDNILYKIKGFNSLVFDDNGLDKLEKLDKIKEKMVRKCVADEFRDRAYKCGYEKGSNDVWELAKKLFGYSCDTKLSCEDLKKIFGSACEMDILRNNTPQEALTKVKIYEKEQKKIKVGDVIENPNFGKAVVMQIRGELSDLLTYDGEVKNGWNLSALTKTGRHIDIQGLLNSIKS